MCVEKQVNVVARTNRKFLKKEREAKRKKKKGKTSLETGKRDHET